MKKTDNINFDKNVGPLELSYKLVGTQNGTAMLGNSLAIVHKVKHILNNITHQSYS